MYVFQGSKSTLFSFLSYNLSPYFSQKNIFQAFLCFLCLTFGRCLRLSWLTNIEVFRLLRAPNKFPLAVAVSPPAPLPNFNGLSSITGSDIFACLSFTSSRDVHMPMITERWMCSCYVCETFCLMKAGFNKIFQIDCVCSNFVIQRISIRQGPCMDFLMD